MPATPGPPPPNLANYGLSRDLLVEAVAGEARASFMALEATNVAAVDAWLDDVLLLVEAGQSEMVDLASSFMAEAVGADIADLTFDAGDFLDEMNAGQRRRFYNNVARVNDLVDAGRVLRSAMGMQANTVEAAVVRELDKARLVAEQKVMSDSWRTTEGFYRRVVRGSPCEFCYLTARNVFRIYKSGRDRFSRGDFAYHPACNCTAVPLLELNGAPLDPRAMKRTATGKATGQTYSDIDLEVLDINHNPVAVPEGFDEWRPKQWRKDGPDGPGFDYSLPKRPRKAAALPNHGPGRPGPRPPDAPIPVRPPRSDLELAAEQFGVDPEAVREVIRSGELADVRRRMYDDAAVQQYDAEGLLEAADARRVHRPPRNPADRGADYDWLNRVDQAERDRLSRKWWSDSPASDPDAVAARVADVFPEFSGMNPDQILEQFWLPNTRRIDAAGAVRRGKVPSRRLYGDDIDVNTLAPNLNAEGFDVLDLLQHDEHAAAAIAARNADMTAQWAERALGDALSPFEGPAPYTMSYQSWFAEVMDVDYAIANKLGDVPQLRRRYLELVPPDLDDLTEPMETVYARIVTTARDARQDIPTWARVPWEPDLL